MNRTTRLLGVALATLALTVALGACGSSSKSSASSSTSSAATGATITIHNFMFSPATLGVTAGTTVTVKNTDSTDHTVTALDGSFDTGPIHSGKTATFTVSKAGTVKYHCNIHNYMMGTIQVTG
jgi:plastocyanin